MRCVPNPVAPYALCILLCASQHSFAQSTSPPRKHVIADPAAEALNKLLDAAQEAAGKQDYAGAAKSYEEYLAKKPDDAIVHYDLGYAYAALNRAAEAKTEFERAIQLDPKMTAAYLNLGVTLLRSDPAAAVSPLQKAADLSPQDVRARRLLGTAFERSGNLAAAIEQYQAARKLDESDFAVRLALGHALLNAGRASDSEIEYRAALAARATDAELSQARRGLAEVLVAEKKFLEAAGELEGYLKSHPDDGRAREERASLLVSLEKYDDALAELDRATAKAPEDLHGLKLRSDIYWNQKRYSDAVPVLQRAAALAPSDADVSARLGEVYLQTKDYPNAVHWLAAAYNMNPKANDVLAYLVDAEYGGKNYAETLRALDELEKRQGLAASNWYFRASCYDNLGQAVQALDAYKKFLQMNKDENTDMYFLSTARVRVLTREVQNKRR